MRSGAGHVCVQHQSASASGKTFICLSWSPPSALRTCPLGIHMTLTRQRSAVILILTVLLLLIPQRCIRLTKSIYATDIYLVWLSFSVQSLACHTAYLRP